MMTAGLLLCEAACSPWPADYLKANVNTATQADVRERLGTPTLTRTLEDGGSEWLYHSFAGKFYTEIVEGKVAGKNPDCSEYLLTFDERRVLTDWKQQDCD
jgi:hypothetical protein